MRRTACVGAIGLGLLTIAWCVHSADLLASQSRFVGGMLFASLLIVIGLSLLGEPPA